MKGESRFLKVGVDMFTMQMSWTLWYMGIVLAIHFVNILFRLSQKEISVYFAQVFVSANIYMLVIGIIAAIVFVQMYVQNGVTRKDYFKGGTIAAAGLSITIPAIAIMISFIEKGAFNIFNNVFDFTFFPDVLSEITEENLLVQMILSVIFTPVEEGNVALTLILHVVNILFNYTIGWLIGSGFMRFGVLPGLGFIALSIGFLYAKNSLWQYSLGSPFYIYIFGVLLMLSVSIIIIRLLTRKMPIKVG